MMPAQSVQAHLDLKGKAMVPIHNTTFDLSLHDWYEPLEHIHELAQQHQVQLITPIMGEPVTILEPTNRFAWWREYAPAQQTLLATQ